MEAKATTIIDAVADFLATHPSSEEILAYYFPEVLQERVDELAEKNSAGELSDAERSELDDFIKMDTLITRLKIKTLAGMKSSEE